MYDDDLDKHKRHARPLTGIRSIGILALHGKDIKANLIARLVEVRLTNMS